MWYKEQVSSYSMIIALFFLRLHFTNIFSPALLFKIPSSTELCLSCRYKAGGESAARLGAQRLQFLAVRQH